MRIRSLVLYLAAFGLLAALAACSAETTADDPTFPGGLVNDVDNGSGGICFGSECGGGDDWLNDVQGGGGDDPADAGAVEPQQDTGGGSVDPVDVPTAPDDTAVTPPEDTHVDPQPECVRDQDCAANEQICEDGYCVDPPDCEVTGDCEPEGPAIELYPGTELYFSYVPQTASNYAVQTLRIGNSGDQPYELVGWGLMPGTPAEFSITTEPDTKPLTIYPGEFTSFDIRFDELNPTPGNGTFVLTTDVEGFGEIQVSLVPQPKGPTVTPEPCIEINPTSIDFGQVARGDIGTRIFNITNCGTAALTVTEIRRGSSGFFNTPEEFQLAEPVIAPTTIAPGLSVVQAIRYEAGLAGQKSGEFQIVSNDPENEVITLAVSGESTPPPLSSQGLHINLEWDTNNSDVDMHLLRPGADFRNSPGDCFYSNMNPDWGVQGDFLDDPFLDVDNVWGYGPENINVQEPAPGVYTLVIHYYSDTGGAFGTASNATVRIYSYGQLVNQFQQRLEATGWTWDVCTIDWPSGRITNLNRVYQQ